MRYFSEIHMLMQGFGVVIIKVGKFIRF